MTSRSRCAALLSFMLIAFALPAGAQGLPPAGSSMTDEAIGQWLPRFGNPFDAFHHGLATQVSVRQTFVVDGKARSGLLADGVILDALDAATYISFGKPETVTGHVAYDALASVAYFHVGCCGSYDWTLARASRPPPYPVAAARLGTVRTTLGLALGDTPRKVIAKVGPAKPQPVIGRSGYTELSYYWLVHPHAPKDSPGSGCGQWQNFVFERGRLVFIDLTDAC